MRSGKLLLCFIIGILSLTTCSKAKHKRFADIDKHITPTNITIHRFDRDMVIADTTQMETAIRKLYANYPVFMPLFVDNILEVLPEDTAYIAELMTAFLSDSLYQTVNAKEQDIYADITPIEHSLAMAFARLNYFYPQIPIPDIYFFVSGFNRSILFTNSIIAIGTDMYLGNDYPLYEEVAYQYMHYGMRPQCIPIDIMSVILFRTFRQSQSNPTLLDEMLYRGRIMYLLSILFSEEKPNEIICYTPQQWEWCDHYEREIWATILDSKDLFSTSNMVISKYVNDAPFTSAISQDSPGRLGTWIGWRIIASYMANNPNISMQTLMSEQDSQKILEHSNYRP